MIDVSELSKQRPLLIGEAPIAKGLPPFAPWYADADAEGIPETTRELLDLAFTVQAGRSKLQAENQYETLNNAFDLSNILSEPQGLIDPLDKDSGHKFDLETAVAILAHEMQLAINYVEKPEGPLPKLYGRVVIVFGRVGNALARASAIVGGSIDYEDIEHTLDTDRLYTKQASNMILAWKGDALICMMKFIWVYHPSHFCRKDNPVDRVKYKIAEKRDVVKKVLQAGIRGDLLEFAGCAENIVPLRVLPLRKKSDKRSFARRTPAAKIESRYTNTQVGGNKAARQPAKS